MQEATGGFGSGSAPSRVAADVRELDDALRAFIQELEQGGRFGEEEGWLRDVQRDAQALQARLRRGY